MGWRIWWAALGVCCSISRTDLSGCLLKCVRKRSNSSLSFTTHSWIIGSHFFLQKCQTWILFGLIERRLKLLNFRRTTCSQVYTDEYKHKATCYNPVIVYNTEKIRRKVEILSMTEHSRMNTFSDERSLETTLCRQLCKICRLAYFTFKFNISTWKTHPLWGLWGSPHRRSCRHSSFNWFKMRFGPIPVQTSGKRPQEETRWVSSPPPRAGTRRTQNSILGSEEN